MENIVNKEIYFIKKKEKIEHIEKVKKILLNEAKSQYEQAKSSYDNPKVRNNTIKGFKEEIRKKSLDIKKFEEKEKNASLGLYSYSDLLNELESYAGKVTDLFMFQEFLKNIESHHSKLNNKKQHLLPILCIGFFLFSMAYYFMHQPKKTK